MQVTSYSRCPGSSPHTRGALSGIRSRWRCFGIIPAYAGSTTARSSRAGWPRDHPRIRGEHIPAPQLLSLRLGSSPHTRGAPQRPQEAVRRLGIIPAYAGSTEKAQSALYQNGDHPRIRGEHLKLRALSWTITGSSPHTRGALIRSRACESESCGSSPHTRGAPAGSGGNRRRRGIIPAYAGSTICRR